MTVRREMGKCARQARKRDSRDVCALTLPVALFQPVTLVSLESGIRDCSKSVFEKCMFVGFAGMRRRTESF